MDISVIMPFENETMMACVKLCNDRGIPTEVVNTIEEATGTYICIAKKDAYYNQVFLHRQFVALWFQDQRCTEYLFTKKLDGGLVAVNDEVYFYKRDRTQSVQWVEKDITLMAT